MERAVASGNVEVWVGAGGQKASPIPLVSLGLGVVPGISRSGVDMLIIEMTPGQARELVRRLEQLISAATPEKT
jgi:hypothetical protein